MEHLTDEELSYIIHLLIEEQKTPMLQRTPLIDKEGKLSPDFTFNVEVKYDNRTEQGYPLVIIRKKRKQP